MNQRRALTLDVGEVLRRIKYVPAKSELAQSVDQNVGGLCVLVTALNHQMH